MSGRLITVHLTRAQADEILAALSNWRLGLIDNRLERRATVSDRARQAVLHALLAVKASALTSRVKE
jgi:hypothetical protein